MQVAVDQVSGGVEVPEAFLISRASYYGNRTQGRLGPLFDLSHTRPAIDADAAAEVASAFARCSGAAWQPTGNATRFHVANESLVYVVEPPSTPASKGAAHGCPPSWTSFVDAVTGALHMWKRNLCA